MNDDHRVPPHLPGSWQQVIRRRASLARALADWLPERRWFAGKSAVISSVSVEQVYPLAATGTDVALLVVAVTFGDGERHRYNVPVVSRQEGWCVPGAVIATLDDRQLLYDAMFWDEGCRAVVAAAFHKPITTSIKPVLVEQSNSSVIVGRKYIAKLIRRLQPGRNPDAELPQMLRANGFAHVPGVAATLDIGLSDGVAQAVIVHELVRNHGDLWAWMLTALAKRRDADTTRMARLVGQRTAEMHQALIGTATTATLSWQRDLVRSLKRELRATERALGTKLKVDLARFAHLNTRAIDAPLMRVHGDLHLGQVLATRRGDIAIIDFEGEPARPMTDRRALQCPLVDLAGLVRSIDYAGRTAAAEGHLTERRRAGWTRRTTVALTQAYLRSATGVIPDDPADAQLLRDLYVLQKALYEIRYELANRPDWVVYPLAAVMDVTECAWHTP